MFCFCIVNFEQVTAVSAKIYSLQKIQKFHLIAETMRFCKIPHQDIRWTYGTFCSWFCFGKEKNKSIKINHENSINSFNPKFF